jgi:hypothetical protein
VDADAPTKLCCVRWQPGTKAAILTDMSGPAPRDGAAHIHAVRFYESQESLSRTVAEFLGEGLAIGQPAVLIGTPSHADAVVAELRRRGVDVDSMTSTGRFELLDARAVLATFMVEGTPDAARFKASLSEVLDRLRRGCAGTVRAYGEMVDLLWQDGQTDAAIRLEMLWNLLAATHDFSLLCGYAIGSFYKRAGMRDICAQHSHVVPAESALVPPG